MWRRSIDSLRISVIAAGCGLLATGGALALDRGEALSQYARQSWRAENGLPQNTVRSIIQSRQGYLWFGTEGGLARFDGFNFRVFDTANTRALKSNTITNLMEDAAGTLWVGTAEGTARWGADGMPVPTNGPATGMPAPRGASNHSFRDRAERTWTASTQGLVAVSKDGKTRTFTSKDGLPDSRITALFEDSGGAVWIGTESGAARLLPHATTMEQFPASDPLAHDAVLCFFEDREGNLWIGTDSSGVTMLRNRKFITFSGREAGAEDQVRCVLEDRTSTVWVGTNGGGLKSLHGALAEAKMTSFDTAKGLSSNIVLALAEDAGGDLLIGTPDGLNRLHGGAFSLLTSADGLAEDFVRSLYRDSDGSVWIGTRRGLTHSKDGQFITYTQANGLGSDVIGSLARDTRGDLWIGTLRGLTRLRQGVFKNYTMEDGLPADIVTDLYLDREGVLWIATQGGGLGRWHDDAFTRFPARLGLPEIIYGIVEDSSEYLWLAAKTGIFRVSRKELDHLGKNNAGEVTIVSYGTSDGLRVSECSGGGHPAVWKDSRGAIWFTTAKGVAVLPESEQKLNRLPPPVALETVLVDERDFEPAELKSIPPGPSRLSFEYAGLSFIAPQKVRFKYRLEGFDRDWVDAGNRRTAYYTNVPHGHYRFHVMARNNDGFWNEQGASLEISVEPHFYETWWFMSVMFAAAALLAYTIYALRLRQVQTRFAAVLGERNRIAREIHDTLAQGFVGVSVQLEIVARLLGTSIDAAKEHLDQARTQVRNSLADARQSIWELRSQSMEHQDFAARLTQAAKRATASSPAKFQLAVHGTYRPLDRRVEDELFRIGQEAVVNAVRHSGAENIIIDLTFDARKLRMLIGDDGCGFDSARGTVELDGHFGVKGMRERAEQIRGELTVTSAEGKGTTVCIEVPVK